MKQALALLLAIGAAFFALNGTIGYEKTYAIAYGMITVMAVVISGTFFWLWRRRATPLALGMSFSWAGAASVLGWWWLYQVLHQPAFMVKHAGLFTFLAIYSAGAVMHVIVMHRSMGLNVWLVILPGALGFAGVLAVARAM